MAFNKTKALDDAAKLVSQRKISQAIKLYLTIAEHDPHDLPLLNTLGDLCVRDGNLPEALRQFHRLADAYASEGFTLKAIAIYKKVVKLDPTSVDPVLKLAELYAGQKLSHEAHAQYKQALALCQGAALRDKAGAILRKLAALDPANAAYRARLADFSRSSGRPEEALSGYLEATRISLRQKDLTAASATLNKAAEIEPGNSEVVLYQACLAAEGGQLDEVRRICENSPQLFDGAAALCERGAAMHGPAILEALGKALGGAGEWSRAEMLFRRLVQRDEQNAAWRALLKEAQDKQRGDPSEPAAGANSHPSDAGSDSPPSDGSTNVHEVTIEPSRAETPAEVETSSPVSGLDLSGEWEAFVAGAPQAAPVPPPNPEPPLQQDSLSPPAPPESQPETEIERSPSICAPEEITNASGEMPAPCEPEASSLSQAVARDLQAAGIEAEEPGGDEARAASPPPVWDREDSAIDDLARHLEAELAGFGESLGVTDPPASSVAGASLFDSSLEELLSELDEDDEPAARNDDPQTHYNLGVAFREMGLLDEAIAEFQKVVKGAGGAGAVPQSLEACSLLGICFMEKQMPEIAVRWLTRALQSAGLNEETIMALTYDLGMAYEQSGDRKAALERFSEVYSLNIDYRDVAEKVQSLHSKRA